MDIWQLERQLAYLLEAAVWSDAPGEAVLTGGAVVSEQYEGQFLPNAPDNAEARELPFARVYCAGANGKRRGRFEEVRLRVSVVAGGSGIAGAAGDDDSHDQHGVASLIGGERDATQGQGKSTGRGLDEIVGRLIESLEGSYGMLVESFYGMQAVVGEPVDAVIPVDGVQVLAREFEVLVRNGTVARHYHQVRGFKATASGGGVVALRWDAAPDRYDRYKYVIRRSSNNGSAPSSPSAGTGVPLATDLATSVNDSGLTVGHVYTYSAFVLYDETHDPPSTQERASDALASNAVTVT